MVHCVVFVMDAFMPDQDTILLWRKKVDDMHDELKHTGVPLMVLLTKIDQLCERIRTDITYCYKSEALMAAVYKAAQLFKVPESYVFPVQNYRHECEMDPTIDILTLLALQHMIYIGTDFLHSIKLSDHKDEDEDKKIAEAETQDLVDFINFHEFNGIFL
ncbi:uncharacterized protein LOC128553195 [Mercenaria mercenaria]|uniref:uncharacterized protein LOC128553195 n=1 Tax=Mercenaria mercenaria TaxID=6596 RepID=UPI00234E399C|nr:uncharacterized protein LOC128553195 [Mercenaria mercenaria]